MTYDSDPTRWTDAPDAAPDLLRDAFEAARHEAPSDLQIRSLALKLAAVGTSSVAIAASGSAAHTTANGATLATASGLTGAKVTATLAVLAALAGAVTAYRTTEPIPAAGAPKHSIAMHERAPMEAVETAPPAQRIEAGDRSRPVAVAAERGAAAPSNPVEVAAAPALPEKQDQAQVAVPAEPPRSIETSAAAEPPVTKGASEKVASSRSVRTREKRRQTARAAEARTVSTPTQARADEGASSVRYAKATTEAARTSEIELLRRAREALDARPRESFRLTEIHRNEYPSGLFAQERDALAVEALLRSGDDSQARERAARFLDRYPSSPHAHRFRETLGLR